jgi:Rad3-related DNA helicase
LIRTKNDSGIVIMLDERVHQTWWWELMLQAFPKEWNIKIGNSKQFLDTLSKKSLE